MRFRILGSLEAEAGGSRLPVGGPSEQKLLAVLLLDANRTVPVSRLVDTLWEDDPPVTAVKQARNTVSRLRKALSGNAANVVLTDGQGYRLPVADDALDACVFEGRVVRAAALASRGEVAEAAGLLCSALGLWRGPALAGLGGRVIEASATAWDERRHAAQETYHEHMLTLGLHRQIVPELSALAVDQPLREQLAGQLMVALYRCGRQADALQAYQHTRAALADELGLDPGAELRRLHQQILTSDPILAAVPADGQATSLTNARGRDQGGRPAGPARDKTGDPGRQPSPRPLAVPRQLPAAIRHFAGRAEEMKVLDELLDQMAHSQGARDADTCEQSTEGTGRASASADVPGGTVVISAIDGTAGIGKTALAVHWAHQVAARFPDGQLYVNLRGFDPSGTPTPTAEALRGFLTALNVPAERVPANGDEQAALYRSLLAGKKMLIVVDNARDSTQVRPLLPGSPGCIVVVTSRCQLNGLVAAQGAHPVSLGLLTEDEARQLLAGRLGRARLAAEPRSADKLISVCARLPLALSIAAAQAATRPGRPLAALAAELHDARNQLDVFDAGDDASVRAAFSWSYGELTERAARMFRLLGLHPGPDISPLAGASLSGLPLDEACHILAELVRAHLIEEHVPGRFTFHDLLYAYARERAREGETETGRQTAISRMLDHYLHTAHGAALLLHPARDPIALGPLTSGTMPERLSSQAKALTWFDAEHRVLLAAVTLASDAGCPGHAWQIAWALANFLDRRGHWDDARSVQQIALAASRKAGDKAGQAHANSLMGRAEVRLGHHDEGRERFREALALFRAVGDRAACARAYLDLGWVANQQGRHSDATAPTLQALAMYRSIGHEVGEAHTLSNLGWHYAILGNHQRAIACCREALTLHRAHGNVVVHAATLDTLGYIHHLLDDYPQAIHYYQQAITRLEKLGARIRVADSLSHLADAHVASGNPRAARQAWQEALTILEQLGHPDAADVRSKLGYFREQLVPHAAQ